MAKDNSIKLKKDLVLDEILITNTGVSINITAAIKDPSDAEKTICILCNHIDEIDAAHKKVVADLKQVEMENKRRLESCELEVNRHCKRMIDETSLRMRAERKNVEFEKKLEENEVRNLRQKKRIQELEHMHRTLKREQEEAARRIKREHEKKEAEAMALAALETGKEG